MGNIKGKEEGRKIIMKERQPHHLVDIVIAVKFHISV
jgi:hypothetical protein